MKKLFIVLMFLSFPYCQIHAYLPHKGDSKEFRLVVESSDFSKYTWHGQIIGGQLFHPDFKVGGILSMNPDESSMKLIAEYNLNKYLKLGVLGGLNNEGAGVGDFVVTGDIPVGSIDILPFVKISHEAVGEAGVVVYLTIGGVLLNVGTSYQPSIKDHQKQRFLLSFGTGLK